MFFTDEDLKKKSARSFVGVYFTKCSVYSRIYSNSKGDAYIGRCPRCGFPIKIKKGENGIETHFIEILCRPS